MKLKFLTILMFAGIAFAGCNSRSNKAGDSDSIMNDSALMDTAGTMGTDTMGTGTSTDTAGSRTGRDTATVR